MYFSPEGIEQLSSERAAIIEKGQKLIEAFLGHDYKNENAREYAHHGLSRRIKLLMRCVDRIYDIIPPERSDLPSTEELHDTAIHLQSFLMNVFGSLDNLAWIWVSEKGVTDPHGFELKATAIGLRKKNECVRSSFSKEFQSYLVTMDKWFDYLVFFRDALAHRIPLYIPPHIVRPDKVGEYSKLEHDIHVAASGGDAAQVEALSKVQNELVFFRPWMAHSADGKTKAVPFHIQLLRDFNTAEEIAWKLQAELQE